MDQTSPVPWQLMHTPGLACTVVRPSTASRLVYSLPHSGRYYPASFQAEAQPSGRALRASEDAYVDDMLELTPELGVHGLICGYARAFCDVNRNPLELDSRLIRGQLPRQALSLTARVKAGFGVIARRLSADQDIYRHPIGMDEVNRRLDLIHRPYHETLQSLLAEAGRHGTATLIDWHSMPSVALAGLSGPRPDVVLGNLHGQSCSEALVRRVTGILEAGGLRVGLNKPFAGGYIIERYGKPGGLRPGSDNAALKVEALQIEINRAIYMNEASLEPHDGLGRLRGIFRTLADSLKTR